MDKNNVQQKPLSSIETEEKAQSKAEQDEFQLNRPYTGRSERGHRSALKIKLLQIALGSSLSVFLLVMLLMGFYIYRLSMEKEQILVELHKRGQQLGMIEASLKTLRH